VTGAVATSTRAFPAGAAERQGLRAGVVSRTGAMVIDIAYVAVLVAAGYAAYAGFRFLRRPAQFTFPELTMAEAAVYGSVVAVLMLTISWSGTGRSAGARVMGLRLLGPAGARVGIVRAFLRAVTCVAFPLGLFWSAVSKRNASVHDLIFGTSVVYDWHDRVPEARSDDAPTG
jgi:uncharacterized RDD family membrane protein YckC